MFNPLTSVALAHGSVFDLARNKAEPLKWNRCQQAENLDTALGNMVRGHMLLCPLGRAALDAHNSPGDGDSGYFHLVDEDTETKVVQEIWWHQDSDPRLTSASLRVTGLLTDAQWWAPGPGKGAEGMPSTPG